MPLTTPIADGPFNASPKSQAPAKESPSDKVGSTTPVLPSPIRHLFEVGITVLGPQGHTLTCCDTSQDYVGNPKGSSRVGKKPIGWSCVNPDGHGRPCLHQGLGNLSCLEKEM